MIDYINSFFFLFSFGGVLRPKGAGFWQPAKPSPETPLTVMGSSNSIS